MFLTRLLIEDKLLLTVFSLLTAHYDYIIVNKENSYFQYILKFILFNILFVNQIC